MSDKWQPIEAAAMDKSEVLFYCSPCEKYGVGESFGELSCFITDDGSQFVPTHWMPLPDAP